VPRFDPIAIVGSSCVLPGALSPLELWRLVVEAKDALTEVPEGRWGIEPAAIQAQDPSGWVDRTVSSRGGYVRGFESVFDAGAYGVPREELLGLDPVFRWLLHAGRAALESAGAGLGSSLAARSGLIVGNLSYPTSGMARYVEDVWRTGSSRADPRNRFMSGLPALLAAERLGLGGEAFALDAACASSLYAIQLACDRLQDGSADLMLAGGVNRGDDLFVHVGFTALRALSPTGRSRPFSRRADGLVPAEGAALVALRRLADAERDGQEILGVIRGIGTSNDGRDGGFLQPSAAGQVRAMELAYASAKLAPASIQLLECHATGTLVGDAVEIESMSRVFGTERRIPIGSLKSNLGHLITAAGAASLVKILEAFRHRLLPPSILAEEPIEALERSSFHVQRSAETWQSDGPRRAAINGFGFGGNNAHLIVEEWVRSKKPARASSRAAPAAPAEPVAIVALEVLAAGTLGGEEFAHALSSGTSALRPREDGTLAGRIEAVEVPLAGLRFPPSDLAATLPQQLLLLAAARRALEAIGTFDRERARIYAGMGCDPEVVRYGVRWRLPPGVDRSAVAPALDSAGVIGAMPNVVANRLNSQFDIRGSGFTVSAERRSGEVCLELAIRALERGECDLAVVGAVDLCCEPAHEAAVKALSPEEGRAPGDAAAVLVLKRLKDARTSGNRIVALVSREHGAEQAPDFGAAGPSEEAPSLAEVFAKTFGDTHAASGLLEVAAAAFGSRFRARLMPDGKGALPRLPGARGSGTPVRRIRVTEAPGHRPPPVSFEPVPAVHLYSAANREGLREALSSGAESSSGPMRLAVVSTGHEDHRGKVAAALEWMREGGSASPIEGVFFRERPIEGALAFVFTGAAASYRGMGREISFAFPELVDAVSAKMKNLEAAAGWIYRPSAPAPANPAEQLWGATYLSQLHAELGFGVLGLKPSAALGLSSGETNALFAFGAWNDLDAMYAEIRASRLYERELSGEFQAARRAWGTDAADWTNWSVRAPLSELRAALSEEKRAYLLIINSPESALIGGDRAACERVVARIGTGRASRVPFELAVHCPVVREFADGWRRLHTRETRAVPGVRFYTHATGTHYQPTRESAAEALLQQSLQTVDFPSLVKGAWKDGVRVFVELGPKSACSTWIGRVLGEAEHLAIPFDRAPGSSLNQLCQLAGALACAGVPCELEPLSRRLAELSASRPHREGAAAGSTLSFPAHWPALTPATWIPATPATAAAPATRAGGADTLMPAPPALPPVLSVRESPASSRVHPLVALQSERASVHERFIADQKEVHERFLRLGRPAAPAAGAGPSRPGGEAPRQLSREELERFASEDSPVRKVRLPEPPLLLVDRVTEIQGEQGSMGKGMIRTETTVAEDSWYLHRNRMPAGILIEAGQSDLLLISWLGVDRLNQGEKVYRLLGCELTYFGELPRPGERLEYEIHVDGYAEHQGTLIFFFHYDCTVNGELRLRVREGQAGFFTDAELEGSAGIVSAVSRTDDALDRGSDVRSFDEARVAAFAAGDLLGCFGPGFELTRTHVRTPTIQSGEMRLFDEVPVLRPGYLRAVKRIDPELWFFKGHFKDDPCMPGTLMFEGCLQTLAFYMASRGFTLERDAWRFEPIAGEPAQLTCRAQVVPASRELVYEVFIQEEDPATHVVRAEVLCTVDGLKAFHCPRIGLRLRPGWPLEDALPGAKQSPYGSDAMLAAALGSPVQAWGEMYGSRLESGLRIPRLPSPPFHFMSRVSEVEGERGSMKAGSRIVAEFDIPERAWFFEENGSRILPLCVLIEAAAQPCGWITTHLGIGNEEGQELFFRHLDGTATWHSEIAPGAGVLKTEVLLASISSSGGIYVESFEVRCRIGGALVFEMKTAFGHFPRSALESQTGLPATDAELERLREPGDFLLEVVELDRRGPRLGRRRLRVVDRVTGLWPGGGRFGKGRIRGERRVSPDDWYFKAHFFADPVQPGSLGLEAMAQLLQLFMLQQGMDEGDERVRFVSMDPGREFTWKYRGQVLPRDERVEIDLDIRETGRDERGPFAVADGALWVDGRKIYEGKAFGMRLVREEGSALEVLDPEVDTWLQDHRPTFGLPALPMMSMVDRLALAARAVAGPRRIVGLSGVQVKSWVAFDGPRALRTEVRRLRDGRLEASLLAETTGAEPRFEQVCTGVVELADDWPAPPAAFQPLRGAREVASPYDDGTLVHGPAFQVLKSVLRGEAGASMVLDAGAGSVPLGAVHPGLLDGIYHGIPNDDLSELSASYPSDRVGYPFQLVRASFHRATPTAGEVRCEVRLEPYDPESRTCTLRAQLSVGQELWAELELRSVFYPKGIFAAVARLERRAFLRDRKFVEGLRISRESGGWTELRISELDALAWFPGTLESIFRPASGANPVEPRELARDIAIQEHLGHRLRVHPSEIRVSPDGASAVWKQVPTERYRIEWIEVSGAIRVRTLERRQS
jgi:acyl transferase domain-containing protein/3-hydroxymyristoyl/3-hydroxydecanoyl-(acyl carrier protein) dehydratase